MLSGRYRTEALCRHWKPHSDGSCLLSSSCSSVIEDLEHILYQCCALEPTRIKLKDYTVNYCRNVPSLSPVITKFLSTSSHDFCQFLIDCSTLPDVIAATRLLGREYVHHHLFSITRTWVYSLHKARLKILGRWNIIWLWWAKTTNSTLDDAGTARFYGPLTEIAQRLWLHEF